MPPRGRTRTSRQQANAPKQQSQPRKITKFGELDTTPTSRISQSPSNGKAPSHEMNSINSLSQESSINEIPSLQAAHNSSCDDLAGLDSAISLNNPATSTHLSGQRHFWSETGSQTRRSSPVGEDDGNETCWVLADDDDDDDDFLPSTLGTSKSYNEELPDTVPLPAMVMETDIPVDLDSTQPIEPLLRVDFSETASTTCRSSPFDAGETAHASWDLVDTSSVMMMRSSVQRDEDEFTAELTTVVPAEYQHNLSGEPHEESHLPEATQTRTPPPARIENRVAIQQPMAPPPHPMTRSVSTRLGHLDGAHSSYLPQQERQLDEQGVYSLPESSPKPQMLQNGSPGEEKNNGIEVMRTETKTVQNSRKRKQRAKTPLSFDEETQQIVEPHPPKKRAPPRRKPIVGTLRDSVEKSSSPAAKPPNKADKKPAPPKRGRKPAAKNKGAARKEENTQAHSVPSANESVHQPEDLVVAQDDSMDMEPSHAEHVNQGRQPGQPSQCMEPDDGAIIVSDEEDDSRHSSSPEPPPPILEEPKPAAAMSCKSVEQTIRRSARKHGNTSVNDAHGETMRPSVGGESHEHPIKRSDTVTTRQETAQVKKIAQDSKSESRAGQEIVRSMATSNTPNVLDSHTAAQDMTKHNKIGGSRSEDSAAQEAISVSHRKQSAPRPKRQSHPNSEALDPPLSNPKPPLVEITNVSLAVGKGLGTGGPVLEQRALHTKAISVTKLIEVQKADKHKQPLPQGAGARKTRAKRNFSISEKGSPILLGPTTSRHSTTAEENGALDFSRRVHADLQRAKVSSHTYNLRSPSRSQAAPIAAGKRISNKGKPEEADSRSSKTEDGIPTSASRIFKEIHRPSHPAPPEIHRSKQADELRSQMFANLQRPNLPITNTNVEPMPSIPVPPTTAPARQSTSKSEPTIAQELHQLVDKVVSHLDAHEAAVRKVPTTYRTSGAACVEKIQRRFVQEHQALVSETTGHAKVFEKATRKARQSIAVSHKRREGMVSSLEEMVLERKELYEHTIDNLRALYKRILNEDSSQSTGSCSSEPGAETFG